MNDNLFFAQMTELIAKFPKCFSSKLKCPEYADLRNWINEKTPLLQDKSFKYGYSTKIYWILNNLKDFPICENPNCNRRIGIHENIKITKGYHKCCSKECSATNPNRIIKILNTKSKCQQEDPAYNENIKLKRKSTIEHNKEINPNYYQDINEKRKSTNILNGHSPVWNNIEKQLETINEKLKENPLYLIEKAQKATETKLEKIKTDENYRKQLSLNISNGLKQAYKERGDQINEKRAQTISDLISIDPLYRETVNAKISKALTSAWALSANEIMDKRNATISASLCSNPFYFEEISQHKSDSIKLVYELSGVSILEKRAKTIEKHRADDPDYDANIIEKRMNTNLEKYNEPWYSNPDKRKQTCLSTYGVEYSFQSESVKEKCVSAWLNNYGVDNPFKSEEIKIKCNTPDVQKKIQETKRRNGTFNTSKPEEDAYALLCGKFGKDNIERQYRSDEYPFRCDFYVKSIDEYIECNYHWTHGGHWFDPESAEDMARLEAWKSKDTAFYRIAVRVWTIYDVRKRAMAEKNGLNYLVFWKPSELEKFLGS